MKMNYNDVINLKPWEYEIYTYMWILEQKKKLEIAQKNKKGK